MWHLEIVCHDVVGVTAEPRVQLADPHTPKVADRDIRLEPVRPVVGWVQNSNI